MGRVVLVTGAGGLLGGEVARRFEAAGAEVASLAHADLDITDAAAVERATAEVAPSVVVHCAAMTNVDACELEPERADATNREGSHNVATAAANHDAVVIAVSTDYVFDGERGGYTEDDECRPIQVYGRSKLDGEAAVRRATDRHYVLRSAWIYGPGGKNFLSKLPDLAAQDEITAVIDQHGSPTSARDLAGAIVDLPNGDAPFGTYHVVNEGTCSFADFCRFGLGLLGASTRITDVRVADLRRPAPRPHDTSLRADKWRRAGFAALPSWQEAAEAFLVR